MSYPAPSIVEDDPDRSPRPMHPPRKRTQADPRTSTVEDDSDQSQTQYRGKKRVKVVERSPLRGSTRFQTPPTSVAANYAIGPARKETILSSIVRHGLVRFHGEQEVGDTVVSVGAALERKLSIDAGQIQFEEANSRPQEHDKALAEKRDLCLQKLGRIKLLESSAEATSATTDQQHAGDSALSLARRELLNVLSRNVSDEAAREESHQLQQTRRNSTFLGATNERLKKQLERVEFENNDLKAVLATKDKCLKKESDTVAELKMQVTESSVKSAEQQKQIAELTNMCTATSKNFRALLERVKREEAKSKDWHKTQAAMSKDLNGDFERLRLVEEDFKQVEFKLTASKNKSLAVEEKTDRAISNMSKLREELETTSSKAAALAFQIDCSILAADAIKEDVHDFKGKLKNFSAVLSDTSGMMPRLRIRGDQISANQTTLMEHLQDVTVESEKARQTALEKEEVWTNKLQAVMEESENAKQVARGNETILKEKIKGLTEGAEKARRAALEKETSLTEKIQDLVQGAQKARQAVEKARQAALEDVTTLNGSIRVLTEDALKARQTTEKARQLALEKETSLAGKLRVLNGEAEKARQATFDKETSLTTKIRDLTEEADNARQAAQEKETSLTEEIRSLFRETDTTRHAALEKETSLTEKIRHLTEGTEKTRQAALDKETSLTEEIRSLGKEVETAQQTASERGDQIKACKDKGADLQRNIEVMLGSSSLVEDLKHHGVQIPTVDLQQGNARCRIDWTTPSSHLQEMLMRSLMELRLRVEDNLLVYTDVIRVWRAWEMYLQEEEMPPALLVSTLTLIVKMMLEKQSRWNLVSRLGFDMCHQLLRLVSKQSVDVLLAASVWQETVDQTNHPALWETLRSGLGMSTFDRNLMRLSESCWADSVSFSIEKDLGNIIAQVILESFSDSDVLVSCQQSPGTIQMSIVSWKDINVFLHKRRIWVHICHLGRTDSLWRLAMEDVAEARSWFESRMGFTTANPVDILSLNKWTS